MANVLLVDAVGALVVALRTDKNTYIRKISLALKASEAIVPLMGEVLLEAGIGARDLDYTVTTAGPGSFTSLRLAFAALKAFSLAAGVPMKAVPTLDAYLKSVEAEAGIKIAFLDARAGKFFLKAIDEAGAVMLETGLYEVSAVKAFQGEGVVLCGPDGKALQEFFPNAKVDLGGEKVIDAIFALAKNAPDQKDYDAPLYFQASSAEEKLGAKE